MDNEYIQQNPESITNIIRSAGVCLQMLLEFNYHNDNFATIFNENLFINNPLIKIHQNLSNPHNPDKIDPEDPILIKKLNLIKNDYIISNLKNILFDDNYNDLRNKFIVQLHDENLIEEANYFNQCLNTVNNLSEDLKNQIPSVIDYFKLELAQDFNQEQFNKFFNHYIHPEESKVKEVFLDLIFNYFWRTYNSTQQKPSLIFNFSAINQIHNEDQFKLPINDNDLYNEKNSPPKLSIN